MREKPSRHRRENAPRKASRPPLRAVPPPVEPEPEPEREKLSAAVTGGQEDYELYSCACGVIFQGLVSASARCPRCGAEQAW